MIVDAYLWEWNNTAGQLLPHHHINAMARRNLLFLSYFTTHCYEAVFVGVMSVLSVLLLFLTACMAPIHTYSTGEQLHFYINLPAVKSHTITAWLNVSPLSIITEMLYTNYEASPTVISCGQSGLRIVMVSFIIIGTQHARCPPPPLGWRMAMVLGERDGERGVM